MFYLGNKLEVKQFVSCTPLEQQNLPVTPLLNWPPSSAGQCRLTFPQLTPKTSPRTAFAVSLWRRSGNGVSRTLTWLLGEGTGSRGWAPRAFPQGNATLRRVAEPSSPLPMHNSADRHQAAAGRHPVPCFRGKRKVSWQGEREGSHRVPPSPAALPSLFLEEQWRQHFSDAIICL